MCNLASWAVKEAGRKKKKDSTGRKLKTKGNGEKNHRALLPLIVVASNGLGNSLLN